MIKHNNNFTAPVQSFDYVWLNSQSGSSRCTRCTSAYINRTQRRIMLLSRSRSLSAKLILNAFRINHNIFCVVFVCGRIQDACDMFVRNMVENEMAMCTTKTFLRAHVSKIYIVLFKKEKKKVKSNSSFRMKLIEVKI